ncbi:MAG: Hsp20/alpha crystallin family protein [Ktedonobacterales bacterium]
MANQGVSRYSPRHSMPLTDAINQLMRDAFTAPLPFAAATPLIADMNLYETNDSYILQVPLPGMNPGQLQITARENVVTIQGATEFPVPENARHLYIGTRREQIREVVQLPGDVDAERASASYENGILTLRLPKAASSRDRAIRVALGQGQQPGQNQGQSQGQNQQAPRDGATTGQG